MRDTELIKKTLIHYGTTQRKLSNKLKGLFYPLALYSLFTYYTSYQIGQTDFYPLALLWLTAQATKQAKRAFSGTFTACLISETPNRSDKLLYLLTL